MVYEVATFQALREALRCKEIWVVGADRWRNPDEDLPADFADRREENYAGAAQPLDPAVFVEELREQMRTELAALNEQLPHLDWVDITERRTGAIRLTPVAGRSPSRATCAGSRPRCCAAGGNVPLVDMLKEAVLRTGCLGTVTSVATGGESRPTVLARAAAAGDLRATAPTSGSRRSPPAGTVTARTTSATCAAATSPPRRPGGSRSSIANATFAARSADLWGTGSTAVASDSTHFGPSTRTSSPSGTPATAGAGC